MGRFKQGDKVVVADSTSVFDRMRGTVEEVLHDQHFGYLVRSDKSSKVWPFHEEELQDLP